MGNSGRIAALATVTCMSALAFAAGVDARPSAQRATFRVTLTAQITKRWDYVTTRQEGDCTVSTRVQGKRTVTLRSARPTIVRATSTAGRLRFNPAVVRWVTARASQGGAVTRTERGLGCTAVTRTDCVPLRRTLANQALSFFRSRRNEISFRRTRDFAAGFPSSCPPQAAEVRAERTGLHEAEGELSERDLFRRGIRFQTASGLFEETTDLEGELEGRIVERVSWSLTFRRVV
jgi:hypothetical protein